MGKIKKRRKLKKRNKKIKNNYTGSVPQTGSKVKKFIPPKMETTAVVLGPNAGYAKRVKKFDTKAAFVPPSCIISRETTAAPRAEFSSPSPPEHKPSPPLIGPNPKKRRKKPFGDNKVFVPASCIINPVFKQSVSSYDWRSVFPKPICLEKVGEIIGPTIKFRHKKQKKIGISFVPSSCIINTPLRAEKTCTGTGEQKDALQALAQLPPASKQRAGNGLYLITAAVIIIVVLAILMTNS
ncbi:hypothetical protein JOC37_001935 [Desulfohalotomaculum tongense]|uniref:hypothetical protein n=1 Tax=Desulforadius tongensis TaxID=1216062 RepID=UPI001956691B|nr:hypothetical protein [Desulforadius tongensis]MBM7855538.1 hypothetical protein [Desulforadius tongensis]